MQTKMYMITETSEFMMSFVIVTEKNNCIIVDGGRPEDMPLLKKYVDGRHVSAWILTHPHSDHITGFMDEVKRNDCADFDIETICYAFPDYKELVSHKEAPDYAYLFKDCSEVLPEFEALVPRFADKVKVPKQGESWQIDEISIEFLYTCHGYILANPMNDSSLVFKVKTPRKTVLFMGDLGPDGGDTLYRESRDKLKSDIVQMAHHGHMNVSMEVYAAIAPTACLWCAPDWLYAEPEVPPYLADAEKLARMGRIRMYGTAVTRKWMNQLGVKEHYVTRDGTQEILI